MSFALAFQAQADDLAPSAPATPGTEQGAMSMTAEPMQALFLIEADGPQQEETYRGSVQWSPERQGGAPAVQATLAFDKPASMTFAVTFKKNTDPSLTAKLLIETFLLDAGALQMVEGIQPIVMKADARAQGDQLIGVPAKISDDYFVYGLKDYPDAIQQNRRLLQEGSVVEIPLDLKDGRRAYLDIPKDQTARSAFAAAFQSW